jgi:hypothetical protein
MKKLIFSFKKIMNRNLHLTIEKIASLTPEDTIQRKATSPEKALAFPLKDGSNERTSLSLYRKILRLLQVQDQSQESFDLSFKLVREEFMNNKSLPTQNSINVFLFILFRFLMLKLENTLEDWRLILKQRKVVTF